jgi:hypothetical protein
MPVNSYKMGPGVFTLGAAPLDISCQVAKMIVEATENIETLDAVPMLCGDDLPSEENVSLTWKLTATIQQDLAAAGVVTYTWDMAGQEVPFTFVPNTAAGRQVDGVTRVAPIAVGGDVKTRPASDIEWSIIGTPTLGDTP